MPNSAKLPNNKSNENLLEMLLDYTENEINDNTSNKIQNNKYRTKVDNEDATQKYQKYADEEPPRSQNTENDHEVQSYEKYTFDEDGEMDHVSNSKSVNTRNWEKQPLDIVHPYVADSDEAKLGAHESTPVELLKTSNCDTIATMSNHITLNEYHKAGEKRVEDLFSRDQFCSMTSVFDELLQQVKEQLNKNYGRVRAEMQFAAKQVVSTEMNRILFTAQQLRDQVISLRSLVQNQERMIARKDQVIDDLMADLKRVNQNAEKAREKFNLEKEQFCLKIVDRFARKRLLTRVFTAWRSSLEQTWKERVMKRLQDEARVECERLISEHNSRTQQLESELRVTRSELETTRAIQAEENASLKMALMRGVCALNMETMSLFNKDVRPQSGEPASMDNLNKNAHNWSTADVIQCYQDTVSNRFGMRTVSNSTPTPRRMDGTANGNPPGLPEPNCNHIQEAWPRQMPGNFIALRSAEHNFSNAFPVAQQNPNDFCVRWLNQTQLNSTQEKSISDKSYFRPVAQLQSSSASQFRVPDGGSPNSIEANCFTPSSKPESVESECQVMELPITTTIKPEIKVPSSSSFSNPIGSLSTANVRLTTPMDSEGARKQLNSRTLLAQKTLNNPNPSTRWSNLPKAHTVQLGVPTGPSSHSSCVTASVQVLRHQPISQATLTCQMNSNLQHKQAQYNPPFQSQLSTNKRDANPTSHSTNCSFGSSLYHG